MLIDCAFHKVTLVDTHCNTGHLAPVDTGKPAKAKGEGVPSCSGKIHIISGMLGISIRIYVVYANADPVMSIAQLAIQPQGVICAQIHRGGECHMNHRPVRLGICPEIQCILTAIGFIGHHLITGYALLDTCHRKCAGVKQVIRVECPFQAPVCVIGQGINIYRIAGRHPDTHTEQLTGIKLAGFPNLLRGNRAFIPAVAYTFKIEVRICVLVLTVIDKDSCHRLLIAKIEICLQGALCHTGQLAELAVFHANLKIKYDLPFFILRSDQLHRALTAAALQTGGAILILTAVPAVIHRDVDPVGRGSFLYFSGIRGRKDHSVDPNL